MLEYFCEKVSIYIGRGNVAMKKLLGILVLGLLLSGNALTDDIDLSIEIKKAAEETNIIKIDKNYSQRCEGDMDGIDFITSTKVQSKKVKYEIVMNYDGDKVYMMIDAKIGSKGNLSKGKIDIKYSPEMDKDSIAEIKQYEPMLKQWASEGMFAADFYGKTLKPIKSENKKLSKNLNKMMKQMLSQINMKDFIKGLKVKIYQEYFGITSFENEKFYVLKYTLELQHSNKEFQEEMENEMGYEEYRLIHIGSGQMIYLVKDQVMECTIFKNEKELVKVNTDIFN